MERINTANKALNLFGTGKHGFKSGVPGTTDRPTTMSAAWTNGVQEEILNVIEHFGLTPDGGNLAQLRDAILLAIQDAAKAAFNSGAAFNAQTIGAKLQELRSSGDLAMVANGVVDNTALYRALFNAATMRPRLLLPGTYLVDGVKTGVKAPTLMNVSPVVQRVSAPSGGTLYAFGDSFTAGQGASLQRYRYAERLAAKTNSTLVNMGVSGKGSWRSTTDAFTTLPRLAARRSLITWMSCFNDVYRGAASVKTISKIRGELRSFLANTMLRTAVPVGDAAVTETGTWVVLAGSVAPKANAMGGQGRATYEVGATRSWNFTGDSLVVGTFNTDGVNERSGSFTIAVDGVVLETFNGDGKCDGISDGTYDNRICHEARVFTGLGSGTHTVVVTMLASAGFPIYLDYFGTLAVPGDCPPVIVGLPALVPAAGWPHGGGTWSEAAMNAAAAAVELTVREFYNWPVVVAHTNRWYDLSNGVSGDDEHPNDRGHGQIADAFAECLAVRSEVNVTACRLGKGADQALATGALVIVDFETELFDDASMHDTAVNPSRIYAPSTGLLTFTGTFVFAANTNGDRQVSVLKNGVAVREVAIVKSATAANDTVVSVNFDEPCNAGDYFTIGVAQNSGASLNLKAATRLTVTATR